VILKVEEVIAMILKYAKGLGEKMGKVEIKDCVVTVPSHWGFPARDALVASIELSGLHPLTLISENTAAGLYYGVERMDLEKAHRVLFYNIGAYNLQASLVEYTAVNATKKAGSTNSTKSTVESVTVLGDYGLSDVGGFAYDRVIAEYFAEIIDKKPERQGKPSIKENKRAMRKMLRECVKIKEVLSANKEAIYHSEGLYDN
jgi:hypoxia up-regulated 1